MPGRSIRSARRVLPLVLLAVTFAAAWAAEPPALTNEDIVRLFAQGTGESELIALIGSRRVAFELSDEMRDELRIAGLPAAVLRAMAERQAAQDAAEHPAEPAAAAAPEPSPTGEPTLTLRFGSGAADVEGSRPLLRLPDRIPPELAEQFGVKDPEARVTNLAIFVGCRTQDHVPDQWRSKTPLGRDFSGTPRHLVLAFVSGAVAREGGKSPDKGTWIELTVPATVAVPLEAGVAHDLTLGLAAEINGRFYLLVRDDRDGILIDGDTEIGGHVSTGSDPLRPELTARFE